MLTIQSVMLVLLGFLLASLLVLLVLPAYWRRAVRLTSDRIRGSMPLTESEIRADKDRVRAEYAIKLHKLEVEGEKQAHSAARQQIEVSRRDAAISSLESEIATMRTALEGYENAHRVMEQTIIERVPNLEMKLDEARKLAFQRDRELAEIRSLAAEQARLIEEATVARTHQRDELLKLNSVVATYAARTREGLADPSFDTETALRGEIEALKDQIRELEVVPGLAARTVAEAGRAVASPGETGDVAAAGHAAALSSALAASDAALRSARGEVAAATAARADLEHQVRDLRAQIEDRATEVAKLTAALQTYEAGEKSVSLRDTRIGMKARLGALQAERDEQVATIKRMRGELASVNDRLARQAQHFMTEMRRLGAKGAVAPLADSSRSADPAPVLVAAAAPAGRGRLGRRLAVPAAAVARSAERARDGAPALLRRMTGQELPRMASFLKGKSGPAGELAVAVANGPPAAAAAVDGEEHAAPAVAQSMTPPVNGSTTADAVQPPAGNERAVIPGISGGRLVDRLSNAMKS